MKTTKKGYDNLNKLSIFKDQETAGGENNKTWYSSLWSRAQSTLTGSSNDLESGSNASWQKQEISSSKSGSDSSIFGALKTKFSSVGQKAKEAVTIQRNYPQFFMFFFTGLALIGLSFFFIPSFVFYPHKVSMLINLGSICIIASFGALKGFAQYFANELMEGNRKWMTFVYFVTIVFNMYASVVLKSYFLTIGTLVIVILYTLKMIKSALWFW